jgi:hypothetical protein
MTNMMKSPIIIGLIATLSVATLSSTVSAQTSEETITMRLTCGLCDKLNGRYNITVGTPEIDSPDRKSIIVNGSIFDEDNAQMGAIPFELDWALDDETIEVMLMDLDTGDTNVDWFDMSKSTVVNMEPLNMTNQEIEELRK